MQVKDKEYFPADLVLFSTTNPEGICYIETMNLDGETNLKMKKALQESWDIKDEVRLGDPTPFLPVPKSVLRSASS